jgi:hypothetical protein
METFFSLNFNYTRWPVVGTGPVFGVGEIGVVARLLTPLRCPKVVNADIDRLGELAQRGPSLAPLTDGVVLPPDWTDIGDVGSSKGPYEVGTTIMLWRWLGSKWRWEEW